MKLITAIPIFRNRFQTQSLFFSTQNFQPGSLIFIPYPQTSTKYKKPALVIKVDDLETQKFWLRKNKIPVRKLDPNTPSLSFLKKTLLILLFQISEKTKLAYPEILQKIFTKKIIKELNQLSPQSSLSTATQNYLKKIDLTFLKKKIIRKTIKPTPSTQAKIHSISELLPSQLNQKRTLHSEKHYLVDEIRKYFGETATKGKGSFSFYLGFFKKIPETTIYQYWAEVKDSRKSIKDQQKLFWWKIGQFLKK